MKKIKFLNFYFSKNINDPYSIIKRNSLNFYEFKSGIDKKSIWKIS